MKVLMRKRKSSRRAGNGVAYVAIVLSVVLVNGLSCGNRSLPFRQGPRTEITGDNWIVVEQSGLSKNMFLSVATGDSIFVVVGPEQILRSEHGRSWTIRPNDISVSRVVHNGDQFFSYPGMFYCYTSRDGIDWDQHPSSLTTDLRFVEWYDTMFIAAHSGMETMSLITSGNGLDWNSAGGYLWSAFFSIVHVDSLYLAVGSDRVIKTSYDAINWQFSDSIVPYGLESVAHNGGMYVAVGGHGVITVSHDGKSWQDIGPVSGREFRKIIWTGKQFIAVGGKSGVAAIILASRDGLMWHTVYDGIEGMLLDIDCYGDVCVAVGENGQVLVSVTP